MMNIIIYWMSIKEIKKIILVKGLILRADQRKKAMYRRSNRMQIAGRVKKMCPKKIGDNHWIQISIIAVRGASKKETAIIMYPLSSQYPRAKIFCTQIFYFRFKHQGRYKFNSTSIPLIL